MASSAAEIDSFIQKATFIEMVRFIGVGVYDRVTFWLGYARVSKFVLLCCTSVLLWTDMFLYGFFITVLPFMLEDQMKLLHKESQTVAANLLAVFAGAQIVLSPIIGAIVERMHKKKGFMICTLVASLASTVVLSQTLDVRVLYLARLFQGISSTAVWIVGFAVIAETIGHHNMGHLIGFMSTFMNSGTFNGPFISGWLLDSFRYKETWNVAYGIIIWGILTRIFLAETPPDVDGLFDELCYRDNQFGLPLGSRHVYRGQKPCFCTTATHKTYRVYDSENTGPVSECSSASITSVTPRHRITHETSITVTHDNAVNQANAAFVASASDKELEEGNPHVRMVTEIGADPMPITTTQLYVALLTEPCFAASMLSILVYAIVSSSIDATFPLHAKKTFDYSSWNIGYLFFTMNFPSFFLAIMQNPFREWWGARWPTTIGFFCMAPTLILAGIPGSPQFPGVSLIDWEIIYWTCLQLFGMMLTLTTLSGMVECTFILEDFKEAYPNAFGRAEEGVDYSGYTRLYSMCTMVYALGTLIGSMLSGILMECAGYFVLNCVLAGICVFAGSNAYIFLEDRKVKPYHRREFAQGFWNVLCEDWNWIRHLVC